MGTGLVKSTEITIKDKKKTVKGHVNRAAIFARSQVIEAITEDKECFYLIYYKNHLVYGNKLNQISEKTFIDKAFSEGIVIPSSHPILTALIPRLSSSIPNANKLFSQLQHDFSLQETVYIVTTLDSFFEKGQLIKIIDKIYYHYRRNGNFMKSFQILQILCSFAPSLKSAKERLDSPEFLSYSHFYDSFSLSAILKKDHLYVETYCFKNRENPENRQFLIDLLSTQDSLTTLLLWLEMAPKLHDANSIEKYTELAHQFITEEEWIDILGQVNINSFRVLPNAKNIIEKMMKRGEFEKAALYLMRFIGDLPAAYDDLLIKIWKNADSRFVISRLDDFVVLLNHLPHEEQLMLFEQKAFQIAVTLLEEEGLQTVYERFAPIYGQFPHSIVLRKINNMYSLIEDPDRMMDLGDYYAEFQQFDKAIDCYSWEMELEPQNPSPVQKISKMYQHKGMIKEAAAYQKVYAQLKSS